jgi:hypothetical protein
MLDVPEQECIRRARAAPRHFERQLLEQGDGEHAAKAQWASMHALYSQCATAGQPLPPLPQPGRVQSTKQDADRLPCVHHVDAERESVEWVSERALSLARAALVRPRYASWHACMCRADRARMLWAKRQQYM